MKYSKLVCLALGLLFAINAKPHLFAQSELDPNSAVDLGKPAFSTITGGPDSIDLGNLNVTWQFPLFSKPGRHIPYTLALVYDSSVWRGNLPLQPTIGPISSFGWRVFGSMPLGGGSSTATETAGCGRQFLSTTTYVGWFYQDSSGIKHTFPTAFYKINGCTGVRSSSGAAVANDGSGLLLNPNSPNSATVTDPSGNIISFTAGGIVSLTDANGNEVFTAQGFILSAVQDTLNVAPVQISGSFNGNFPATLPLAGTQPTAGSVTFTYTDSNGSPEVVSMNWGVLHGTNRLRMCS